MDECPFISNCVHDEIQKFFCDLLFWRFLFASHIAPNKYSRQQYIEVFCLSESVQITNFIISLNGEPTYFLRSMHLVVDEGSLTLYD